MLPSEPHLSPGSVGSKNEIPIELGKMMDRKTPDVRCSPMTFPICPDAKELAPPWRLWRNCCWLAVVHERFDLCGVR